jgi:hypothetical protein
MTTVKKRRIISKDDAEMFAQDMLTAALQKVEAKIGKIDGDLAGTIFSDDWVQRKFRTFIILQVGQNAMEKEDVS